MLLNGMKQEDKDLLLKDLCARLPYGVKVQTAYIMQSGERKDIGIDILTTVEISMLIEGAEEHKPYLFPLSSMTEEQKIKCFEGTDIELDENSEIWSKISSDTYTTITNMNNWLKVINWLLKNHFDYHGLIEKGLAIDCTNLNIY